MKAQTDDIICDIETGALPEEHILPFLKIPAAFDEAACKAEFATAREDSEKGRLFLEKKRAEHGLKAATEMKEQLERACLKPETGRILALGLMLPGDDEPHIFTGPEGELCGIFWGCYRRAKEEARKIAGWNFLGFDLPFIIRRSWALGVKVPFGLFERGRYANATFLDLMELYACGQRNSYTSLDHAGRHLLGEGKPADDIGGENFAAYFLSGDPQKKEQALAHLRTDLLLTRGIHVRLEGLTEIIQNREGLL